MDFDIQVILTYGSTSALVVALLTAVIKTRSFVGWIDHHLLQGSPRKISSNDIVLFNRYFEGDEIRINKILREHPELMFLPYDECHDVEKAIDESKAKRFHEEQISSGHSDDPHAFVYGGQCTEMAGDSEQQSLLTYVIGRYSQLRSLPKEQKNLLLILGANNLVINPSKREFIFHHRGKVSETQTDKMHGFGGGYMPYWEKGKKTVLVRRDDCKSLRYTAMRELHEESGLLSLDHIPGVVCAIEERHTKEKSGKFGYLTFFYITLFNDCFKSTSKGDSKEGFTQVVAINMKNIRSMVIGKKYGDLDVHPQLRAMLLVWMFLGCPGLHFTQRLLLSNFFTRSRLRSSLT